MNRKLLLAAAMLAISSLAQAATLTLTALGPAKPGGRLDLLVSVSDPFAGLTADEELLSFGFRLSHDSAQLALVGFTAAASWDDDSAWLGAGQFGGSIFPGMANANQATVQLGTLHFDALQAGLTSISLLSDAGNLNHGLGFLWSDARALDASLELAIAEVPEPASMLLAALGVSALNLSGRRRAHAQVRVQDQ